MQNCVCCWNQKAFAYEEKLNRQRVVDRATFLKFNEISCFHVFERDWLIQEICLLSIEQVVQFLSLKFDCSHHLVKLNKLKCNPQIELDFGFLDKTKNQKSYLVNQIVQCLLFTTGCWRFRVQKETQSKPFFEYILVCSTPINPHLLTLLA